MPRGAPVVSGAVALVELLFVKVSGLGPARRVVIKLVGVLGGPELGVEVQTAHFVI